MQDDAPVLIDLCCKAGGASAGYARAGFRVIGVDIEPQPNYPHEFHCGDAMEVLMRVADGEPPWEGGEYPSAWHGSFPCQAYSQMTHCRPGLAEHYPKMLDAARTEMERAGLPWVLENVPGSGLPAQADLFGSVGVLLCGAMFGLELYRHRLFEASFPLYAPNHPRHDKPASKAGHWKPGTVISVAGNCAPIALARQAMGIGWTNRDELAEAIPPAYTEYIGGFLMAVVNRRRQGA